MGAPDPVTPREYHSPCAQCGADLRFAPGQTHLRCDHCGHVQAIPGTDTTGTDTAGREAGYGAPPPAPRTGIAELDLRAGLAADLPGEALAETRTTSCPNCGAVVDFAGDRHATECPFCATPVVIDTGTTRAIKPQALIPFAISETQAREALGQWLRRRWFAPAGLADFVFNVR